MGRLNEKKKFYFLSLCVFSSSSPLCLLIFFFPPSLLSFSPFTLPPYFYLSSEIAITFAQKQNSPAATQSSLKVWSWQTKAQRIPPIYKIPAQCLPLHACTLPTPSSADYRSIFNAPLSSILSNYYLPLIESIPSQLLNWYCRMDLCKFGSDPVTLNNGKTCWQPWSDLTSDPSSSRNLCRCICKIPYFWNAILSRSLL